MGICHSGSHAGTHAGHPCPTQPGTQLPVTQSSLSSLQLVMKIRPHFISAPVRISPSQDCQMEMAKLLKPHVSRWLRCDSKPCVFGKEPAWPRRFTHHHCLMPFTGTVHKCTQSRLLFSLRSFLEKKMGECCRHPYFLHCLLLISGNHFITLLILCFS